MGVLRIFGGVPVDGMISVKLQSGFVEITLLHSYSPVGLLYVCRSSFFESTSVGLLLNADNFI